MFKKYILALIVVCFSLQLDSASSLASESAYSSVMPDATISVDITTVCQYNDSPVITFTGAAGTAPYTFTYTIDAGAPQTITSTGDIVTLEVPTNNDGIYVYTLTSIQDAIEPMPTVISGQTVTITVTEGPDSSINGPNPIMLDGVTVFRECNNSTSTLSFTNGSSTTSTLNTNYTINWGDGSPNFSDTNWSLLTHDYAVGIYTLTYTIQGNNSCITTQEYTVFVGSNPAVSLGNPGNTDICNTQGLTFPITGTDNNPPGTIYTITFNDGSDPQEFPHPPPADVTHFFANSSCNTTSSDGSNSYANSFSANIVASNPCSSSSVSVVPIYVSTEPEADFTIPSTPSCINTQVCFEDLSTGNSTNGSNANCNTNPKIIWAISPSTFTVISGSSLGNDFGDPEPNLWTSGSEILCVSFTQAGTYTITQTVGNRCGTDVITQTICVEAPVDPQFNLSATSGCTPLDVTTTNTTDESVSCTPPTYQWQVGYTADFCGTTPEDWSFTNGTSATSTNPSFNFVTPGTYTIQLTGSNDCGNVTNSQQVIVKQPPTASIDPIDDLCNANSIAPVATVNSCTDNDSSVMYNWQFPGATTTSSNLASPGIIEYATPGTYTISLQVTNDCGVSAVVMETFTIEEVPVITNTDLTQDICSGASSSEINLMSSATGTTYLWTASATTGISGFSPSGTSTIIPSQIITTTNTAIGTVTYTVTPSLNGCEGMPVTFIINVSPAPEITTQPQPSTVCQDGTPITLNVATSGTSPQYQWFSSTTNNNSGGTSIASATNPDYIPPTDTIGNTYYYCEITFTSGGCSLISSQTALVTVTPNATITSQPATTQNLCVGSTIENPLSVAFTDGTGTVSYQWFSNATNSTTGGTAIAGATNADYTPPIFMAAGNFYYYVALSFAGSGCNDIISDVAEIIVAELPIIDLQPITTQVLCQNTTPQTLEVQVSGGLGAFSYQWFSNTTNNTSGGTAIAGETNTTYVPSTNVVGTLYYYCVISQVASSSCTVVSTTSEVIVNAAATINSQPQSQELCLGEAVNDLVISYSNGAGTPSFQWYSNTIDDTTSGAMIPSETTDTYTPIVTAVGTNYYYCIITFASGGCSEITSATAEIIVNETPSVSNFTETICSGNSFSITPDTSNGDIIPTNTTYTWTTPIISPAGSVIGATAETTPQTNISQFLTNTTNAVAIVTYTITPTDGNCNGTPFTIEITLNSAPEVTMQPQPSTVCQNGTPNTLSVSLGSTSNSPQYQWFSNTTNSNTGGTPIASATNPDYIPPTDTIGTIYYYCEITFTSGGCSLISSQTALVTVTPNATITSQPTTTQSLCVGSTIENPLSVAFTDGAGTVSYQWFSNATNSTTGGTAIAGATNADYTPPIFMAAGNFYYYVALSFAGSGCNDIISDVAEIIVAELPIIDLQPITTQILCQNTTPQTLEVQVSGGLGAFSYQWFSNTTNNTSGGTAIAGETNTTYVPSTNVVGTLYYYCVISQVASSSCTVVSTTSEVIVNAAATINSQPQSQELCLGEAVNDLVISYNNGVGTPSFQWYSNIVDDTTSGTMIPSETTDTYTPIVTAVGTNYYYCIITFATGGCSEITSATAEIIVNETPSVSNFTETICSGNSFSITPDTSNGDIVPINTTYTWTTPIISPAGSVMGATAETTPQTNISQFLTNTTDAAAVVTYTVTPTDGNCNGTPFTIEITLNSAPEVTMQPQPSTVCQNGTPNTLSVSLGSTSNSPQYQWFSNTTDSNTGGTPIASATNPDYIPPTDTIGTIYYYCEITFTSGGCSLISSQTALVTVTPNATITNQPTVTQSLCVGSTIENPLPVAFTDGTGTVSYQWFSNATNNNTGGTPITGATNATYTPPAYTTAGNFYYYVELSFAGSGCNDVISDVAEIIVVESPVVDAQPITTQTLCQNTTPQTLEVQVSGGLGAFSYQWFSNATNSNTGGTAIAGETNATYVPPTGSVGTLYYYCVILQAASSSCSAISDPAEVIVNLGPEIDSQPQSQELCLGETVNDIVISYSNGVGTPSFQWYSNIVDDTTSGTMITSATTNTYMPIITSVGITYYYCIITFASGGCLEIISDTAEIIINETPSISDFTAIICSGNDFTITPDTSNGDIVPTTTSYTWTMPTINPPGSVTGATAETTPQTNISQTLINTTTIPAIVTYTVTPTTGICDGIPFTVEVTVNPAISANETVTVIECFGENDGAITTNITGGVAFMSGSPYIISWTGPMGFTSSDASISNLAPGDYTLAVQDEGGCPFSETYTITEPPQLVLTIDIEDSISCFGENDGELAITVSGGTPNYNYSWTRNAAPFSTDEDISNLTVGTYELTVTDANNCNPVIQSFVITEPNELTVSLVNQTNVACFGETSGAIEINASGGTPIETSPGIFEYNYAWTGPNGFTSTDQNLTNLEGGTYNLIVTDANGCDSTFSAILTQPDEIMITFESVEILCYGDNDASITVTNISGGSGSYTISWSNFGAGMSQTNLSAGNYTITVTDTNNCTASVTVTIPEPPIFTINPVMEQISCFGANDGRIILNFQGGQNPIDFAWTDDPTAGVERNNLGPGTYTIIIVDAVPCTITETFTILEPSELTLAANITNALDCDDPNSGAINLLISGGSAPFTVNWSNGAITEDLIDIPPGDYLVTVVDANGCETSETYTIIRPSPIIVDVATETVVNCNAFLTSQNFTAQVSGGVPPFSLNWSSGTVSGVNDEVMTTTQNGLVILEATDALGCVNSYTFEVDIPELSDADFSTTSTAFETFGIYSQIDPIQFTNTTTGDYLSVSWDFGDGNFSNEENPIHSYASPGVYTVIQTVTFPGGCVYTKIISLAIEKGYKLIMPTGFTPNEDGLNDYFRPVFIGLNSMDLNIYDTWGSLIYSETGDDIQGWDGKIKGEYVENGNYYYTFTAKTFFGAIVQEKGPLTLIL